MEASLSSNKLSPDIAEELMQASIEGTYQEVPSDDLDGQVTTSTGDLTEGNMNQKPPLV
jgi:hypothetical protein